MPLTHPPRRRQLAAVMLALLTAGCARPAPETDEVRPVRVMQIAPASTSAVAEFSGEVRPRIESRVGFQVAGRIVERKVEVGQRVAEGQVLAALDASDYQLGAEAARAQLAAAQVDRDQNRADFRRFQDLHRQGFISGAELDRRRALLDAAEARYTAAAAQSSVSGNQVAYAVLKALEDGVITSVDAEVGQVVAAGQSVVRIAQTGEKEVAIAIPENRLLALRAIRDVRVTLWAGGAELQGRVREIAPAADPATRTYPTRITLLAPPPAVALGMTATVRFEAPLAQPVIALPLQALLREAGTTYVWKLDRDAGTVARSAVEIATVAGNDVVVAAGVQPGDTIVTAGVHLLKQGQKVRVLDEPATTAGTAPVPMPKPDRALAKPARPGV